MGQVDARDGVVDDPGTDVLRLARNLFHQPRALDDVAKPG